MLTKEKGVAIVVLDNLSPPLRECGTRRSHIRTASTGGHFVEVGFAARCFVCLELPAAGFQQLPEIQQQTAARGRVSHRRRPFYGV
ncbi:MAG: hypothetical protein ACI4OL_04280 [Gemmiger sp.]